MHVKTKGAEKLAADEHRRQRRDRRLRADTGQRAAFLVGGGVYLGNPNGIVITAKEGKTLYHMGDTDMFGGMALIAEFHKPDIGIVPIGDRFTMGAQARPPSPARSSSTFKTILPCHYGTFPGMLDPDADRSSLPRWRATTSSCRRSARRSPSDASR